MPLHASERGQGEECGECKRAPPAQLPLFSCKARTSDGDGDVDGLALGDRHALSLQERGETIILGPQRAGAKHVPWQAVGLAAQGSGWGAGCEGRVATSVLLDGSKAYDRKGFPSGQGQPAHDMPKLLSLNLARAPPVRRVSSA
jgi:hypothetical protein